MHENFPNKSVPKYNMCTVEYGDISPPTAPTQKKWPVFKRAYRRNNERSCVLFFNILLEYQFFTEMLKQVRGSVNEYEDTDGPFYFGGGGGGGYLAVLYGIKNPLLIFHICMTLS